MVIQIHARFLTTSRHYLLQAAPVGAGTNQRSAAAGASGGASQGGALPPPPPPAAGWGTQQQRPELVALQTPAFAPVDPQNAPSALLGQQRSAR